jgi:hypothetical protein
MLWLNPLLPVVPAYLLLHLLAVFILQLSEAIRDAKLSLLHDLKSDDAADAALAQQLVADLKAEAPDYLPLLLELMRRWVGSAFGPVVMQQSILHLVHHMPALCGFCWSPSGKQGCL